MKIIDTGKKLKKAGMADVFELWENRKKLVVKPIQHLSRKHGDVIYGRHAVNQLLGVHRTTYDYDVYSSHSRRHAIKIEQSIDQGTDSNLAYIKPMKYKKNGKSKTVFRIKIRPHGQVECDFQQKPKGLTYIKRNGVRYETLNQAKQKYAGMIKRNERHRMPNAFFDHYDVTFYKKNRGKK